MNYLDSLKQQHPEITKYSDDEIISVLPKIDPSLSSMEPQALRSFALTEQEPSGLWGLAKSGYHNVKGSRAVAGAASDLNDLNDPEFYAQDLQPRKVQTGSLLGMSGDELRRRSVASTGGEEQLMQEAQRRLDTGAEHYQKAAEYKLSPTTEQFLTGSLNPDSDILSDLMADPVTIIAEIGAQSAYSSVESMLQGAAMGVVGGPAGMMVGSGMGSARIEFANSLVEGLREAGVDVTDAQKLRAQLAEAPDLFAQVADKAKKRAAAVGALDGAAMGLASVPMGIGRNAATKIGTNLAFQGAAQSGLGAGGEALGQYAADGEVGDMRAVAAEAAGELVTAPVDVAAATYGGMNGRNASPADRAASSTDEAIQQARQFEDRLNRTSFFSGKPNGRVTATDMGLQMPEQRDWSKYDASPAERPMVQSEPAQEEQATPSQSARDMSGMDGLIITADRMGFLDEAALLRTSKRLYKQAEQARANNEGDRYFSLLDRADRLYTEATEFNESVREIANQFPVPSQPRPTLEGDYVPRGTIIDEDRMLPNQHTQTPRLESLQQHNRLTNERMIYGEEPADVRASREQRAANDFSARYGQEGQTPYRQAAIEGELDRSGELPPAQRQAQLPSGTGQMDMGRDRQERTFTPTPTEYEGVGRNVVERQAGADVLRLKNRKTITQAEMIDLTQQFRQAVTTRPASRTEQQRQLIKQLPKLKDQVNAGTVPITQNPQSDLDPRLAGQQIDSEWTEFAPQSGTLNVPRAQMPQVKAEHRGALVNFLNAKGVQHEQVEVDPVQLKPTQQEFSPGKVDKARQYKGGERSILISSDGHVVDGHHQWLAKREQGEPIKAIQLQAPIRELLSMVNAFPSSEQDGGVVTTPNIAEAAPVIASTDADQTAVPRLFMRRQGQPFPSEQHALNSIPFRQNKDHAQVIPVDGGFAIQIGGANPVVSHETGIGNTQTTPVEASAPVTAEPLAFRIDPTETNVRVLGDPQAIRQKLREGRFPFKGAEVEGGLSFGKKMEPRIREVLGDLAGDQQTTGLADDVPRFSRTPETRSLTKSIQDQYPGVKLGLAESDAQIELARIELPTEQREQGIGSEIMSRLIEHADKQNKTLVLTPSADFGGNKARLTAWYKRLGFVENKGRNRDYEISEAMYRPVGAASFSRSGLIDPAATDPAIPLEDIKRIAGRIVSGWKNAPEWTAVATDFDLPANLQKTIDEQNLRGNVDGIFHGDHFYLIGSHLKTETDVERVILHEALGHYGLRQLYGKAIDFHLEQMWRRIDGVNGLNRLQKKYNFGLGGYWRDSRNMDPTERRVMMMDELVAHIAATGTYQPDIIQRIAHLVRQGLRKIMAGTRFAERLNRMTDVELLRIVAAARNAVVEGETRVTTLTHDPRFVRMFEDAMYGVEDGPRFSRTGTADQFDDLSDPQSSFLGKIGPKTTKQRIRDRISGVMDNIGLKTRQGMVDRYASLLELDKKAQGEDVVENRTRFSSWVLSKMSHAADGALSAMLTHGRIQYADGVIELQEGDHKGLLDVLKALGSTAEIERFMGWIAANRSKGIMEKAQAARDRAAAAKAEKVNLQDMLKEPDLPPLKVRQINKAIKDADAVIKREMDAAAVDERLFTPEEVAAGVELNRGKTKDGKPRPMLYNRVFKEFQQHRDDVLAIAEEAGIVTPDNRQMWRDEFYVPFYRVMEEEGTKGPRISKGLSRQEAYKRMKGGTQEVNDLLENTLMNFQHLLSASLKNNAARQALKNAEKVGIATRTTEAGRNKKSSTYVLDQGEKVWYDIEDELVFESLSALTDVGSNTMSRRIMRSFKRTFTSFTTISPQFIVANTLRDAMQSIAIGNMSYNAFSNVYKGAKAYGGPNNKGRTRGDMLASGAAFSFGHIYGAGDIDALKAGIQRQIKGARTIESPKDVVHLWRAVWDQYTGYGDTMENSNRAAIYEQNLSKGKLYAAFQSRDLMDFSSQGAWPAVKFLTDVVPFLNARLVGLDRLYRGGIKPSFNVIKHMLGGPEASMTDRQAAQRFAIVVGSLTAATIALYLANADDERFKELEEWERDAYWHVWVGDHHFTIPKPFEIGAIATMAERTLEQVIDDTKDGKLFAERLGHVLTDTFAFNPIPQAVKPMFDLYANKDSFTGRDIESMSMLRLSPLNRVRANTSDPAYAVSWLMDKSLGRISKDLVWSPVQIDFLIQGYLGWVGGMGASTVDVMSKTAQGVERPDKAWHEYQPIRRFYRNDALPKSYTRYGTEFYNSLREVGMIYADIQHLRKLGEYEEAARLQRESRNILRYRQLMNRTQKKLSKINAQIKLVRANSNIGTEAKRRRIDVLTAQRNRLTQRVVEMLE